MKNKNTNFNLAMGLFLLFWLLAFINGVWSASHGTVFDLETSFYLTHFFILVILVLRYLKTNKK